MSTQQNQVTAVVDCGVAPSMGDIILDHYNEKMTITHFEYLVDGLPKIKKWLFSYKAPFSSVDVIEEYTHSTNYVKGGEVVIRDILTDCEYVNFDRRGYKNT